MNISCSFSSEVSGWWSQELGRTLLPPCPARQLMGTRGRFEPNAWAGLSSPGVSCGSHVLPAAAGKQHLALAVPAALAAVGSWALATLGR